MALSGSKQWTIYSATSVTGIRQYIYAIFDWERTAVSSQDNTSTISWTYSIKTSNISTQSAGFSLYIDGENHSQTFSTVTIASGATKVLGTGTAVITHLTDGSKTFTVSTLNINRDTVSASFTLDTIIRPAKIVSGMDFTDEENPTITYTNPAGDLVESIEACISFDGSNDDIAYRYIDPLGTSYTFELTGSERSVLWSKLDEGTSTTVRFYIKTTIDGETFWDSVTNILTFVNYKPVLTPTVIDNNYDTVRLTGDENTLVRYMSDAYYSVNGVARKGATIASQSVRNGDTYHGEYGTIEKVYSNTFYFEVTDSRGYTTNDVVVFNNLSDKKWIDYVKLTCSFTTEPLTAEGDLVVNVSGKYFNGSFGAASNKYTLEYNITSNEGQVSGWTYVNDNQGIIEPTVDENNNYTYSFTIKGLDYNQTYQLSLRASDELISDYTYTKAVLSSVTLFDWGKTDFNFNIPVQMNSGFTYPQTVLWSGASQMGVDDSIDLDYPISSQPSGIVLVFSLFRDEVVTDASVHTFFISKAQVQYLFDNAPHMFMMGINSNLSIFGSKYVYISDTSLTGFSGNTASGTSQSGITFDNSKFVLRYVLGV